MINHMARRGADVVYGIDESADARFRTRQRGGAAAGAESGASELFSCRFTASTGSWRSMRSWPSTCATRAWRTRSCWNRARRWRSIARARAKAGKVTVGRVCIDSGTARRSGGRHGDSRPPPSFGRRLRAADHRHQQAHGPDRKPAGNREPRIHVDGGRLRADAGGAAGGGEDAGSPPARKSGPIGA